MTVPSTASSARMVGRDGELQTLVTALEDGRAGHPRAVVVRGEAGIGKTRLLTEFRARAAAAGGDLPLVTAVGQCIDLGPIGAPFTPIRRLLHELYEGVGDEAFRAAAGTPAVVAALSTLVPELSADGGYAPTGAADYITEAIERIVENLSARFHLLLIIEDLHWADAATLALLKTLAGTLRGSHVTMVMTYRSDDVGRGHPLRPVLAELDRSRVVVSLEVKRLTADDIAAQAALITGRTPSAAELERLLSRSEGVPFFVEELVNLAGSELPDTLRDLVLARYEALSPLTREIVRVVAAGGPFVDHDLLARVHSGAASELDTALREALTANVLIADGTGYSFRHALMQEAVHDELLPSERAELHRRYAEELQRRSDEGEPALAATIAEHWLIARDNVRAFDATVQAYLEAKATYAAVAQARLGERLLELWLQVPDASTRAGFDRHDLYLELVQHSISLNDDDRGIRLAEEGLSVCPPDAVVTRAALLRSLSLLYATNGYPDRSAAPVIESAHLLEGRDEPAALAQKARAYAALATYDVPYDLEPEELMRQALDLVLENGDPDDISNVLVTEATYYGYRGRIEESLSGLRRAIDVHPDAPHRLHIQTNLVDALGRAGRFTEAVEVGEAAIEDSVAVGLERGFGAFILANTAECLAYLGEVERARRYAERAVVLLPTGSGFQSFVVRQLVLLAIWADDRAAYERWSERAPDFAPLLGEDREETFGWAVVEAEAALWAAESARDDAERREALERGIRAAALLNSDLAVEQPGLAVWLLPPAARLVVDGVAAGADGAVELRPGVEAVAAALPEDGVYDIVCGLVAATLREADSSDAGEVLAGWRDAVAAIAALGTRGGIPIARVYEARLRLARALAAVGEETEVRAILDGVMTDAPGRGVPLAARVARRLAGLSDAPPSGAARPGAGVAGLTARELQVLELVAQGLTNPEIGKRLFISPKTASVHVSAILAKIGAANRAEAASLFAATQR